jgi:hypothetical protein
MGQRHVHPSHRWSTTTNTCKGCGCVLGAPAAQDPCPKPYKPKPREPGEEREP